MADLGETTDPRQLVPGHPEAIDDNVVAIRGRGRSLDQAGDDLKKIDSGAWTGDAADAFRDKFSYEPARWHQAGDALLTTATALERYASTLRWAQHEAAEAIRLWQEAEAATQQATAQHEAAVARVTEQNRVLAASGDPTRMPEPPFTDPGEAKRQAAREQLDRARQQLSEAGDQAAATIRARGDEAPEQSLWGDIGEVVGEVGGFVGDFAEGAWDSVSGTAELLWDLSPHRLLTDPAAYGETWKGVGQTVASAVTDPVEFGKQLVGWEHWKNGEPGRALGQIAGGAILGYGAGKIASTVGKMRMGKRTPGVKPNIGDYFQGGATPKASDLEKYAEAQGWRKTQNPNGPPKYVDENGVPRMTLKSGSDRAPGSGHPHVELKDANGQRIDPEGNPVTRRSVGNHTPIEWDW
ncbi:WXG100 family type VII secretion target [Prauserella muralis]|uniref:Putative T7SS secretion signal domain-containing protein n=1 Tax=Prauserella muralis TaxID=588067 RepID=A0A2V4AZ23_9PSEU|nr:hypothetical protein [Prauserella muralis]PXY21180.1 hypothetical protein BAY60_27340 [Prauserella muralis]TWE30277.1 hypothetical protein FHX69_2974 [Prauserella muralis]